MVRVLVPVFVVGIIALAVVVVLWRKNKGLREESATRELIRAEALIGEIQDRCIEMASVGDPTAQTILDDIRLFRLHKEIK